MSSTWFLTTNIEFCSNYRDLSPEDEIALRDAGMNRVTDTCIPEDVIRHLEGCFIEECVAAANQDQPLFSVPSFLIGCSKSDCCSRTTQIPVENSWLYAAYEKRISRLFAGI